MEFTINLTTVDMAKATDWCGVRSGADYNKWKETSLTPIPGEKVASPTIEQSPLSIECRVSADSRWFDPQTGVFALEESGLIAYSHGKYFALGDIIGKFGFSVKKDK